jgi:hypothetical protein
MPDIDAALAKLAEPIDVTDGTWEVVTERPKVKMVLSARVEGELFDAVADLAEAEGLNPSQMANRLLREAVAARRSSQADVVTVNVQSLHRMLDEAVRRSAA